jgi:hypothetical protein
MEDNNYNWIQFFSTKVFFKHFLLSLGSILVIILLVLFFLKSYTMHDDLIELPDYKSYLIYDMDSIMESKSLRYVVIDSIYNDNLIAQSIIDQDPKPGSFVKIDRRIYFTIVSKDKKNITVPNLIDLTLRRATAKLQNSGLEVGQLKYVPDMAKNAVLKQMFEGREILAGESLPSGTKIDLVIGDGLSDVLVELPNLIGLTLEDAVIVLKMNSLKIGLAIYDANVIDSANAIIYNQIPASTDIELINLGRNIDVYLKPENANE